jgi:hypothetical protein
VALSNRAWHARFPRTLVTIIRIDSRLSTMARSRIMIVEGYGTGTSGSMVRRSRYGTPMRATRSCLSICRKMQSGLATYRTPLGIAALEGWYNRKGFNLMSHAFLLEPLRVYLSQEFQVRRTIPKQGVPCRFRRCASIPASGRPHRS